jgi:hypothetical protein
VDNTEPAVILPGSMGGMKTIRKLTHDDRGDVPGWVLISLMTAGLVIAIWAIAGPALGEIFESALARVTGF